MKPKAATGAPRPVKRPLDPSQPAPSKKRMLTKPNRWTVKDDEALRAAVEASAELATVCWEAVAAGFPEGSAGRHSAPECESRWNNVLKLGLRKGRWLEDEDAIVKAGVAASVDGQVKWADIAASVPGRTAKQVRARAAMGWWSGAVPGLSGRNEVCRARIQKVLPGGRAKPRWFERVLVSPTRARPPACAALCHAWFWAVGGGPTTGGKTTAGPGRTFGHTRVTFSVFGGPRSWF